LLKVAFLFVFVFCFLFCLFVFVFLTNVFFCIEHVRMWWGMYFMD
jgi:hypothetical protein